MRLFLLYLLIPLAITTNGQYNYSFTATTGAYTDIAVGTDLNTIEADDVHSAAVPLGFTFVYNGVSITTVRVNSNGWVSLETTDVPTAAQGRTNDIDAGPTVTRPALYPLWDDLDGATGSGVAKYETTGAVGSRVWTMEWRNWQWNWGATGITISFQCKLYETTNVIEFIYRQESGAVNNGSGGACIGHARGTGSGNFHSLNNSGASPTSSTTVGTDNIATKPATNQVYRWTPCTGSVSVSALPAGPYCGAANTTLTATGPGTITWSPATGLSSTTGASVTCTATTTTTYTVTANDAGCIYTNTIVVTVNPNPVINTVTATPNPICINGSSQLQVNAVSTTMPTYCSTVNFNQNDEAISLVQFAGINNSSACAAGAGAGGDLQDFTAVVGNVIAGNTYPITVSGTTDGNFVNYFTAFFDWNRDGVFEASQQIGFINNTACALNATNNVTVPLTAINGPTRMRIVKDWVTGTAQPPPHANYPANPCGTYDYGQAEDYTLNVTGGAAPTLNYNWSPSTYLNNTAIANPLASAVAATQAYTVTVTDPVTLCPAMANLTLTANAALSGGSTITPGSPAFCAGGSVILTANPGGGGGPYTYRWYNNLNVLVGSSATQAAIAGGTWSVAIDDACGGYDSTSVSVTENPTPTASATSNSPLCLGGTLNLNGTTDIGTIHTWTGPNGFSSAIEDPSLAGVTFAAAGTYTYTAATALCTSVPATVVVAVDAPVAAPTITPAAPSICVGGSVALSATPTAGQVWTVSGASLTIPTTGNPGLSTPYPATATVSGLPTAGVTVTKVTLTGSHTWQNDMDVLLRSPYGTNVILMSDCGNDATGPNWGAGTYVFQDGGALMNNTGSNPPGTYAPIDLGGGGGATPGVDVWPAPGPGTSPPNAGTLSGFFGDPNGVWSLFVADDTGADGGSITAWSIEFTYLNVTYTWSPATGLSTTSGPTTTASHTSTETYTLTASNGGCSAASTVTVTVNPLPTVTCPADLTVCGNDPAFALTGASPAGGTYSGTGVSGGNFDPSVAGTGTHTITYSYTDGNGCSNTCTFTITVVAPTLWYLDADADSYGDPANDSLACAQPAGYVADNTDDCPTVFGINGDSCSDGNPFTTGDILVACVCTGTPVPCDNWTLTTYTDANGGEITWQIVDATSPFVLASGGPYPNNSSIAQTVCVPQGACFDLVFNDAGGNGITPGGWVLTDQNGRRVIDNYGNGGAFSSTCQPSKEFCSPVSNDALTVGSCDKLDWLSNEYIVAAPNAAVSAQWLLGDQTDDGYQFWFLNPVGGYSRRILHNHATSMGYGPPSATRACHLPLGFTPNPIPFNTLLNVRVRTLVNGVYGDFGPACRFMLLSAPPACPTTQLEDDPLTIGTTYSCGSTGKQVNASGYAGKLWANIVSGATHYKWRFEVTSEGYARNIVTTTYFVQLGPWSTNPLLCGTFVYDVTVAVSMDGGATFCPFGPVCTAEITNNAPDPCTAPFQGGGGSLHATLQEEAVFTMWPNPNRGDQLNLSLSEVPDGVTQVFVEVYDLFGKRVHEQAIATDAGFTTVIELNSGLASGLYTVNVTAGPATYTERLVIQ